MVYKDENLQEINLTDFTFSIFEPTEKIALFTTVEPVDLINGKIKVRIEWDDSYRPKDVHSFRVVASFANDDVGSEKIEVSYT